jgi:hypothetical protein
LELLDGPLKGLLWFKDLGRLKVLIPYLSADFVITLVHIGRQFYEIYFVALGWIMLVLFIHWLGVAPFAAFSHLHINSSSSSLALPKLKRGRERG